MVPGVQHAHAEGGYQFAETAPVGYRGGSAFDGRENGFIDLVGDELICSKN